jgi:hypothetical protein
LSISVDDQQHADEVWEKVAEKEFPILSDPCAADTRKYVLHKPGSQSREDIALRTTALIGPDRRERWRCVSRSVPDIPSWNDTLTDIEAAQAASGTNH